jgi:hypothetical protein
VDDEAKVGGDHAVLGVDVAALDALGELDFLRGCEQGVTRGLLEEQLQRLEVTGLLVPLVLLDGRLVQALDIAPLGLAAADAASETMLLLGVAVRGDSFQCRQSMRRLTCRPLLTID